MYKIHLHIFIHVRVCVQVHVYVHVNVFVYVNVYCTGVDLTSPLVSTSCCAARSRTRSGGNSEKIWFLVDRPIHALVCAGTFILLYRCGSTLDVVAARIGG